MAAANFGTTAKDITVIRAKSALSRSTIPAIRELFAEHDTMGIVLRGRVGLYYYKQLAQELVRKELEDTPIVNQIEVVHLD